MSEINSTGNGKKVNPNFMVWQTHLLTYPSTILPIHVHMLKGNVRADKITWLRIDCGVLDRLWIKTMKRVTRIINDE